MLCRTSAGALLAFTGLLVGCKPDRQASTGAPSTGTAVPATVTVTATDYTLDLPAQLPAGSVTLNLVNQGKELHQAMVVRLEDGKTVADLAHGMAAEGQTPAWLEFIGGPNAAAPGMATNASSDLAPGHYAVVCFIPSPDGTPHLMKGMIRPFEVVAGSGTVSGQLPEADDTVTMAEYSFAPAHPLTPGRHTILVENMGEQPHELVLLQLAPGKSAEDFAQWGLGGMKGPPPALPLGGVGFLGKGGRGVFAVALPAGDYAFICFAPDAKDGKPHLMHGMMMQVRVG